MGASKKKNATKGYKVRRKESGGISKAIYFLIYMIIGLIPHVYKMAEVTVAKAEELIYPSGANIDVFNYYKAQLLLVLTVFVVILYIYKLLVKDIKLEVDAINIGALIFAVFVIVSSVFSQYSDLAFNGSTTRFEGTWVWLSYTAIFLIVRSFSQDRKFIKNIVNVFLVSSFLMGLVGILQTLGYNMYVDSFLKWIIYPQYIAADTGTYIVELIDQQGAIGALFNANYYGVYMAFSTIIAMGMLKKILSKETLFVAIGATAMLLSNSEAALLGFTGGMAIYGLYKSQNLKEEYKEILVANLMLIAGILVALQFKVQINTQMYMILGLIFVVEIITMALGRFILPRLSNINVARVTVTLAVALVGLGVIASVGFLTEVDPTVSLESLEYDGNIIKVKNENNMELEITFTNEGFTVLDQEGNDIGVTLENNEYSFTSEGVNYTVQYSVGTTEGEYAVTILPYDLKSYYDIDGNINYLDATGTIANLENDVDYLAYLHENGSAYTVRSYIWSAMIPLIMDNPIMGYGIESYPYEFPQDDFVSKYNNYTNSPYIIVDKPHNMYVQMGYGFGLIGLLAFMVIIIESLSNLLVASSNRDDISFVLLAVGAIFLVSSVFNDSSIGVTTVAIIMIAGNRK